MISSGKQDVYLTFKPEITFFKRVYKRHTNFSMELIEVFPEQVPNYNNIVSYIINKGDAIYRCYLEIDLSNLLFSDSYITNSTYIEKKNSDIANLSIKYTLALTNYNNLKNYIDIDMILYRNLYNSLQIDNISIDYLKNIVSNFNYENKTKKERYINKIDTFIYSQINITDYILSLNKFLVNGNIDTNNSISKNTIINKLNKIYESMVYYLRQYNNNMNEISNEINNLKNRNIDFNYSSYLGHNFFQYFTLEIGGQEIKKYSNDILHINQMHQIKEDFMPNYLEMIGHTKELNNFNSNNKGNQKIIVPLIFWFNKDPGGCLPLVGLQYSTVVINAKINNIFNIINFENYEKMFNDILQIKILFNTEFNIQLDPDLIYLNYKINYNTKYIEYDCLYINNTLLKYKFPDLSPTEIDYLLKTNGTEYNLKQIILKCKFLNLSDKDIETILINNDMNYLSEIDNFNHKNYSTQFLINKFQWIKLMLNLNNPMYSYNNFYYKFASYYPYIDFNLYYSLINSPNIKLIGEFIYFDDAEREKFANSKLEYIVESYDENIFTIQNQNFFTCDLTFDNPCKELYWYIQPQIFQDKITNYGQNVNLIFNSSYYFNHEIVAKQNLIFNQMETLFPNVGWNYYTNFLSYKYLNNILPEGLYYNTFCLYPEESQPSGTINLRYFKNKQYYIEFNPAFINEYNKLIQLLYGTTISNKNSLLLKIISKNYELIVINKGRLILLFSS